MSLSLTSYSSIKAGVAKCNGEVVYAEALGSDDFIKGLYRHQKIGYPKFFKMDRLSRLAFVAAELALKGTNLNDKYAPERIGVYLGNRASSLDTDRQHQSSINDRENYFPSPAIFVYTLPNITIGEIAIKHKLKGPNAFFIFDKFEPQFFTDYISDQFKLNKIDACLFGWIEMDGENYEASIFLTENNNGKNVLSAETIRSLYNK
ncbi:MAG: beta-ketoacyl synthase N-terminal-like domain-containing protein [Salibacteraceae bacterium]